MGKKPKKIFNCEICDKSLSSNEIRKKHISIVHGDEKRFVCNVCSHSFGLKTELTIHTQNYHQGEHHTCKICWKDFARLGSLEKHIKVIHEAPENYKCNSCGKSFTESGTLKIHIETIHEGQKNYKCDSCGKSFTESGTAICVTAVKLLISNT